jgi:hypothetical protein
MLPNKLPAVDAAIALLFPFAQPRRGTTEAELYAEAITMRCTRTAAERYSSGLAIIYGRWFRCQRPSPAAVGDL